MNAEGANKGPRVEMDNLQDSSVNDIQELGAAGGQTENILVRPTLLQTLETEKFARESSHLLNIFPDDIWHLIFEKMKNSDDQENLLNSSLFWRNLLHSKRKLLLFKKVWPFLAPNYKEPSHCGHHLFHRDSDNTRIRDAIHCTSCNRKRVPGWYSEILKFRLVCRKWNEAIDDFYQYHAESWQDTVDNKSGIDFIGNWSRCNFSDSVREKSVEKEFVLHFDKTHGNWKRSPFISKSIAIFLGGLPCFLNDHQLQDDTLLMLILGTYGSHVQHCRIEEVEDRSLVESYSRLKQLMEKMPNLICLDMASCKCLRPIPTSNDLAQVADFISLNPLPKLKHLQLLSVYGLHAHTFNELTRSNNHIAKLRFEESVHLYAGHTYSLFNLNQLYLIFERADKLNLFTYPRFNCPLTKLTIRFLNEKDLDLLQVFTLIRSLCGNALTDLVIISPFSVQRKDCVDYRRFFKNIRKLEVTSQGPFTLDMLSLMKNSLEDLNLFLMREQPKKIIDLETKIRKAIQLVRPLEISDQPVLPSLKRFQYFEGELVSTSPIKMWDRCRWEWNKTVVENTEQGEVNGQNVE